MRFDLLSGGLRVPRPLWRWLLYTGALACLYALVGVASVRFARFAGPITPVWPLSGLVLAALLRFGPSLWPGMVLGDVLVARWLGYPVTVGLSVAAATTCEALLGRALVRRRIGTMPDLSRLDDVLTLLGSALISTFVGGWLAILALWQSGTVGVADLPPVFLTWWTGDTVGVWLVTPLLLAWLRPLPKLPRQAKVLEATLLIALLIAVTGVVFSERLNYAYLLLVCLLWASLRFGLRGTTAALAVVSAIAIPLTATGGGPFARENTVASLIFLQTFLGVLAGTALLVGALTSEQRRSVAALRLVADVSACLTARGQLATGLAKVAQRVTLDFADVCCIELLEAPEQIRRFVATRGVDVVATTMVGESALLTVAASRRQPHLSPNADALATVLNDGQSTRRLAGATLSAPLLDGDNLLGMIAVAAPPNRQSYRHDDTATIAEIAQRLAQAIRTARLEEQVVQARKLAALGRLAGGIAHDFNNLLTVISGNADLAAETLAPDEPTQHDIAQIGQAARRGAALVQQLLLFARRKPLMPAPLDVNTQLASLAPLIRRIIRENVAIVYELAPHLEPVLIDSTQFEQMVMNMALNARDAMPEGGRLVIATTLLEDSQVSAVLGTPTGRIVRLMISDNGEGMTPQVVDQIFEPFFTTKSTSKGTGLGLSTCQALIAQSGGHIQVRSAPGKGTAFLIDLPTIADAPDLPPDGVEGPISRGNEGILLVEDDPDVRALATRLLEAEGYTVLAAVNGAEALDTFAADDIALVISDLVLPDISGDALVARLRASRPALKGLLMSGYGVDAVAPAERNASEWPFLPKPFTSEALLRAVRAALDDA